MKRFIALIAILLLMMGCSSDDSGNGQDSDAGISLSTQDLTLTLNENPQEGASIGQLEAQSNIENEYRFIIEFADLPDAITLVEETGEILVNDPAEFNFELNPVMEFGIRVSVRSRIERATLTINIADIIFEGEFSGSVELRSQEQVDFFGRNRYESVTRDLTIGGEVPDGETPITNLLALQDLRQVGRDFTIKDADALPIYEGLNNFQFVGNDLVLEDNDVLSSITAFNDVIVSRDFEIIRNNQLAELVGPSNLSVGRDLIISENSNMETILGFAASNQIQGLSISLNAFLTTIDAFGEMETVSNDIIVLNNPNLVDLDFFTSLTTVAGSFTINKNPVASNIHLPNLEFVEFDFAIITNNNVTSISGLEALSFVGGNFHIRQNSSLDDFCVFTPFIENGIIGQEYLVIGNNYNPTQQDIIDGNCSL